MRLITTLFVAACAISSPVLAEQVNLGSRSMLEAVRGLKPGQYVWAPNAAPEGPALLVVNLATQRAVLFRNGVPWARRRYRAGRRDMKRRPASSPCSKKRALFEDLRQCAEPNSGG